MYTLGLFYFLGFIFGTWECGCGITPDRVPRRLLISNTVSGTNTPGGTVSAPGFPSPAATSTAQITVPIPPTGLATASQPGTSTTPMGGVTASGPAGGQTTSLPGITTTTTSAITTTTMQTGTGTGTCGCQNTPPPILTPGAAGSPVIGAVMNCMLPITCMVPPPNMVSVTFDNAQFVNPPTPTTNTAMLMCNPAMMWTFQNSPVTTTGCAQNNGR